MSIKSAVVLAASVALVSGCGEQSQTASNSSENPTSTSATPVAWILETQPENAISISEAKASAEEGQEIAIRGRIGGRKVPITEGSPVFTVVDMSLPHCGEIPGDKCGTPWDYCCETAEDITANAATIRLASADPRVGGLGELDEVIIKGTVGPRPNAEVLTINATGVYVVGE